MIKDQTPLFIPIGNFSDHCNSLDGRKLMPLVNLIQEMEMNFYKTEKFHGIHDLSGITLSGIGLNGIHIKLLDAVLKLRLVPLFDWLSWKSEAERFYKNPALLRSQDTVTLGKIMTVLLRSQTIYGPTFLESKIKDKFVLTLLKAIVYSLDTSNVSGYINTEIVD
jgi:hypothetical protein